MVIYGIQGSIGNSTAPGYNQAPMYYNALIMDYEVDEDGELELVTTAGFYLNEILEPYFYGNGTGNFAPSFYSPNTGIAKFYYHHDRLGTIDYLSDNVAGSVKYYATYRALYEVETGLYLEVFEYVYDMFLEEKGKYIDEAQNPN